jgi:hypothetical protein
MLLLQRTACSMIFALAFMCTVFISLSCCARSTVALVLTQQSFFFALLLVLVMHNQAHYVAKLLRILTMEVQVIPLGTC